jgi:hypothetical protein
VVGAIGASALAVAGCGAASHANEPRPSPPTRVSIILGARGVTVQPGRVAFGPERSQQIPQNQNHTQPPIQTKAPLNVVFVTTNQTASDSKLEIHGPRDSTSEPVYAHSPGTYQVDLPTGSYTISAANIPGAGAGKLVVGPYRASSENDVLLP